MTRRTIVLTGASSGIGEAAARALVARGHDVVPIGRDPERTRAVSDAIGADPVLMDLADLGSVRTAAVHLLALPGPIDVLALNAGAMFARHSVTRDGVETTLQTNHLGHFLLERLLHERLVADRSLVVFTCSVAVHLGRVRTTRPDRGDVRYGMVSAYADSKLAGLLFIRELARRGRGTGLTAVAFHPGTVDTAFPEHAGGALMAQARLMSPVTSRLLTLTSAEEGAATLVRLGSAPPPRTIAAHYLGPTGREAMLPRRAQDRRLAARVWDRSEQLVGL
jgi:NAD(P)-dependent dehydrogenase (short-subunit alcohol dehydrogenase family)